MTNQNFTLKFGKYKGQQFSSTPTSYQEWLLKQDWFKLPTELTEVQKASKQIDNEEIQNHRNLTFSIDNSYFS
jgi:uncharacterized protein (DUF3820 family)